MPDWLTIVLASLGGALTLYGAILSTALALRQWRRDKPDLRIECLHSYRLPPGEAGEPVLCFTIEARNHGFRPIEVQGAGFLRDDGYAFELPAFEVDPGPLPRLRGDGESVRIHYHKRRDIPPGRTMAIVRVYVRAGGDRYEAEVPEGLRPLEIERRWPYG